MAKNAGVRKTAEAYVVSQVPDVCLTPGAGPVPYPIIAYFTDAERERPKIRFTGQEAINLDGRISRVMGDEPGTGGGIVSGCNMGYCRPISHSTTSNLGGQPQVYNSSQVWMNCQGPDGPGNTVGSLIYIEGTAGPAIGPNGEILGDTNPPVEPETEEEGGWLSRAWGKAKDLGSSLAESVKNNPLDYFQGALDVVGLIPVVGEIADGANALIYAARGDYANAALSAAAMIPFVGVAATGAKVAGKFGRVGATALRYADEAKAAVEATVKAVDGFVVKATGKIGAQARRQWDRAKCWWKGDPVDVVSGAVMSEHTDFALPGPLPLVFERLWFSTSAHDGPLGRGWHHPYDAALLMQNTRVAVRLPDGRYVPFEPPRPGFPGAGDALAGQPSWNRAERLALHAETAPPEETPHGRVASGEIIRYRMASEGGRAWVFERAGHGFWPEIRQGGALWRLARVEDANGNAIRLAYDDHGDLAAMRDSAGRALRVETDGAGRLAAIYGPEPQAAAGEDWALPPPRPGEETLPPYLRRIRERNRRRHLQNESPRRREVPLARYRYDARGRLVEVLDALGYAERYAYDAEGLLVRKKDRFGVNFYFEYEGRGAEARCVRTWGGPDGVAFEEGIYACAFTYDLTEQKTTVTDGRGGTEVFHWNAMGLVERRIDAAGREQTTRWDAAGRKRAEKVGITAENPFGQATRYEYDEEGCLTAVRGPEGGVRQVAYDEAGRAAALTDEEGHTWTRAFDTAGNVASVTDPEGGVTTYETDARGLPTRITDPLGRATHLTWDAAGNLAAVKDRAGAVTRLEHDALGRLVKRTAAEGRTTHLTYDRAGRITEVKGPGGRTSRFAYDQAGNLAEATDAEGRVRRFGYAARGPEGVLASVTEPSGAQTRYAYDREGDLSAVTDATGRQWLFARNEAGEVIQETDFTGRRLRYGYDEATGQLASMTNARGQTTTFARDAAGRLARRTYADGTEEAFAYDKAGRLVEAANEAAMVAFAYDGCGRVVEEKQVLPGEDEAAVRHEYDAAGNRTGRVSPDGRTLAFSYDAEDRLSGLSDAAGVLAEITRDALGRETERAMPGGVRAERRYSYSGELLEQRVTRGGNGEATPLMSRDYGYDAAGRLTAITDSAFGHFAYEHDLDGRLASVLYPEGHLEKYLYDAAGNVPGAPVKLKTPSGDGQSSDGAAGKPPDWSVSDNASDKDGVAAVRVVDGCTLAYDADGNLIGKREPRGLQYRFRYDAAGRMSEATRTGEVVGRYAYDALGRRVLRETGGRHVRYVWDGDQLLSEKSIFKNEAITGKKREYVFSGFEPVAYFDGDDPESACLVECDQVGTPRLVVDREGALTWEASFTGFGEVRDKYGEADVDLRYPGQIYDQETGLSYNRFRYYDAGLRQYTQADPIGLWGGTKPHNYVPSPAEWIDPFGLSGCPRSELLPGEGDVGTYGELIRRGRRGDNLTPHHMPSDAYMRAKVDDYKRSDGISMMMEQPTPGSGGRHRRTASYGSSPDLTLTPRQALARDIADARRIYSEDGLYTPQIRRQLQEVVRKNKEAWPDAFSR